jgi:hypothetical protein
MSPEDTSPLNPAYCSCYNRLFYAINFGAAGVPGPMTIIPLRRTGCVS